MTFFVSGHAYIEDTAADGQVHVKVESRGKEEPVHELQKAITSMVERLVLVQQSVQKGLSFWGRSLLAESEVQKLRSQLNETKTFLESIQAYTSPGAAEALKLMVNSGRRLPHQECQTRLRRWERGE